MSEESAPRRGTTESTTRAALAAAPACLASAAGPLLPTVSIVEQTMHHARRSLVLSLIAFLTISVVGNIVLVLLLLAK